MIWYLVVIGVAVAVVVIVAQVALEEILRGLGEIIHYAKKRWKRE